MAKSKPKIQKRLAKIVMASLLLSGMLPGMMSPSVAHAEDAPDPYGTVTKDGSSTSVDITSGNTYGYGYGNEEEEKKKKKWYQRIFHKKHHHHHHHHSHKSVAKASDDGKE